MNRELRSYARAMIAAGFAARPAVQGAKWIAERTDEVMAEFDKRETQRDKEYEDERKAAGRLP